MDQQQPDGSPGGNEGRPGGARLPFAPARDFVAGHIGATFKHQAVEGFGAVSPRRWACGRGAGAELAAPIQGAPRASFPCNH